MSSAREHHDKAEELLEQARTTPDQISRSEILAEAQVHATLALSAPAGNGPPGPGRDEAAGSQSTGTEHQAPPKAGDLVPARPAGQPYPPSAPGGFPSSPSPELRQSLGLGPELPTSRVRPAAPGPAADPPWLQQPHPAGQPPARPAGWRPAPVDPGEEELDDPGDEEPGGPEEKEQDLGGFKPFSF